MTATKYLLQNVRLFFVCSITVVTELSEWHWQMRLNMSAISEHLVLRTQYSGSGILPKIVAWRWQKQSFLLSCPQKPGNTRAAYTRCNVAIFYPMCVLIHTNHPLKTSSIKLTCEHIAIGYTNCNRSSTRVRPRNKTQWFVGPWSPRDRLKYYSNLYMDNDK